MSRLKNKKLIVNSITYTRIIGIPFLFLIHNEVLLLIVANIMFLTDYFDGYLARKWNVVSTKGAILDLIADKLLVIVLLTYGFLVANTLGWLLWALIVGREVYSIILRFNTMRKGHELIGASFIGKLKTTLQFIALDMMILVLPGFKIMLWIVVILSYYSFLGYFKKAKELNE